MEVSPGEYQGFLSGEEGSDEKDVYKVSVGGGKTLSTRVVPSTDEILEVAILDGNRREIRSERSANEGAIVKNEVLVHAGGNYYIAVFCRDYPACSGLTEYSLTIEEKEGISEELKNLVPFSEEGVPQDIDQITRQMQEGGEKAKEAVKEGIKGLIYYIVLPVAGGVIFLIVLVIVIVIIVKKKKGKDQGDQQMEE